MKFIKSIISMAVVVALAESCAMAPAWAGTNIAGDSDYKLTTKTSIGDATPALKSTTSGNVSIDYLAQFLGIPLPQQAYIISSFPYAPFAKPTITGDNVSGASSYAYSYDSYMGKSAWVTSGESFFVGSVTLYIKAKAKVDSVSSGYFHGGTGTGTGHVIDSNVRDYIKSHK